MLINQVIGAELVINTEKEVYNMCEGIKGIREDAKKEGAADAMRKVCELRAKMKAAGRLKEFDDALEQGKPLEGWYTEFDVK